MKNIIIACCFSLSPAAWGQAPDWLDYSGLLELHAFLNNSRETWLRGGFDKLRYDEDAFPVQAGKAALHLDLHLTDTLWARTLATAYTYPGFDPGLVEAYLQYRPVPRGPMRLRARAGAFHLPGSRENVGIGWSSIYSVTPSVINAWLGEETRVIGAELELAWPGRVRRSAHDFSLRAGVYGFNDGIGTLLAYRGWAQHDRQTGLGDYLPLVPEFPGQLRRFAPFREIDDRPGYYAGGSWSYLRRIEVELLHYDNRADPTASRGGQIAWETRFEHYTAGVTLPGDLELMGQYLTGETYIHNLVSGFRSGADYSAWFLTLTRRVSRHRLSLRYEEFKVDDLDPFQFSVHNSNETGRSWMLAWRYQLNDKVDLGAEWLQIRSERENRDELEGIVSATEDQLLLNVSYRF